ncbi:MAG: ABC transporter ATP-binding protein [Eubacteriales bacterium]|nr:ABC transporter ATP-binding protein [Eubacteriales bacterium]
MPKTENKMSNRHALKRILGDTKPIMGWLIISAFISLVSVCLALIAPEIVGQVSNEIFVFRAQNVPLDMASIVQSCLVLVAVYGASALCSLGTMLMMNNVVSRHFTCTLRIRISDKIRRIPIKYVDKTPNGEIISRMTDDVSVMGNTVHNFLDIVIQGFVKLVGISIIIFYMQPIMAAAVIIFVPLSLVLSAKISQKSMKHFMGAREVNGKIYALAEEDFTGFDTIKAFNLEERQQREYGALVDKSSEKLKRGYYLSGIVQPIVALTNNAAYIAICIIGGWFAIEGWVNVGEVVAFILYAKLFAGPLESIANGLSMMQNTFASANRVYELLDQEEMKEVPNKDVSSLDGNITFEHVNFSYDPAQPLITDLNIEVKSGQKVAIVGPTGGGKTTIVNLLMRFYDVDSGRILVDGMDIMDMSRADLRSVFSMVLQDTWLFSGTIYDNIAYGMENATREQVEEAARQAHIDYFINTLPDGYNTVINEESTNISSGQKQLLTIARAYLSNRKVLILDEATSNVDTRTEILIQNTMDDLMRDRTSFVIAHRLSTIIDADIILVVDKGRIVEQGSHKELLKKKGFYAEIYNSQYELLH